MVEARLSEETLNAGIVRGVLEVCSRPTVTGEMTEVIEESAHACSRANANR